MSIVTTKKELKDAIKRGDEEIIVEGELVEEVRTLKKFGKIGIVGTTLACVAGTCVIVGPLVLAPFTKGKSLETYREVIKRLAETAANNSGDSGELPVQVIMAAIAGAVFAFGSILIVIAIINDYEVIEFESMPPKLKLRKKCKGS